jgi:hypothetical protein
MSRMQYELYLDSPRTDMLQTSDILWKLNNLAQLENYYIILVGGYTRLLLRFFDKENRGRVTPPQIIRGRDPFSYSDQIIIQMADHLLSRL